MCRSSGLDGVRKIIMMNKVEKELNLHRIENSDTRFAKLIKLAQRGALGLVWSVCFGRGLCSSASHQLDLLL
jgi:hypothetical protein